MLIAFATVGRRINKLARRMQSQGHVKMTYRTVVASLMLVACLAVGGGKRFKKITLHIFDDVGEAVGDYFDFVFNGMNRD